MANQPENGHEQPGAVRNISIMPEKYAVLMYLELATGFLKYCGSQLGNPQGIAKNLQAKTIFERLAGELEKYQGRLLEAETQAVKPASLIEVVQFSKKKE